MNRVLDIEVVFASPDSQLLVSVSLPGGATVADAISASKLQAAFPGFRLDELSTGIWGQPVDRQALLRQGDRVEIYRKLEVDPMSARRLRASG